MSGAWGVIFAVVCVCPAISLAQGAPPPSSGEKPVDAAPAGQPEVEPTPERRPAPTPIIVVPSTPQVVPAPALEPKDDSALHTITDAFGFQIMGQGRLTDGTASAPPVTVGLRRWGENSGWDAGLGVAVLGNNGSVDMTFGLLYGYLIKLSDHPNLTTFFEPQVGAWTLIPDSGDKTFALNLRLSLGAEIRLGMIDLPRVGLTTRVSAGVDILHQGSSDTALIGTGGSINNGILGLIEGALGFIIYI